MKITNTASYPRVINYANGRNMRPGDESTELPINTIHNPMLWKDFNNNMVAIRLSEADQRFLTNLQDAHNKPIVVQVRPVPTPVAKPQPAPKAEPVKAVTSVPQMPEVTEEPSNLLPIPESSGRPSLADLKRLNQAAGKLKIANLKSMGLGGSLV